MSDESYDFPLPELRRRMERMADALEAGCAADPYEAMTLFKSATWRWGLMTTGSREVEPGEKDLYMGRGTRVSLHPDLGSTLSAEARLLVGYLKAASDMLLNLVPPPKGRGRQPPDAAAKLRDIAKHIAPDQDQAKPGSVTAKDAASPESRALAMLIEHPDWTDTDIAAAVGVNRTTVYDWEKFKVARKAQATGELRIQSKRSPRRSDRINAAKHREGNDGE